MDAKQEAREFLTSRRARVTPERVGLQTYGGNRRVPGLRREEVALLAGVSVDYYTRLERGNLSGVSETVLQALARALQLDEAERAHLFHLARAASPMAQIRGRRQTSQRVHVGVRHFLDAVTGAPVFVRNGRMDILATNELGRAFYAPLLESPHGSSNTARFCFLDPAAQVFYADWDKVASDAVAILRSEAGRDPCNRDLFDLIGELSTRSKVFRSRWAAHDVRHHSSGVKRFHHPVVGDLTLSFETMTLTSDPSLTVFVYTAEPGSKAEESLRLLASWAAPAHTAAGEIK